MASYVNGGNINWSGNWQKTANVGTIHASTSIAINTTLRYTKQWAGVSTNVNRGVMIYLNASSTSHTVTVQLQKNANADGSGAWANAVGDAAGNVSTTIVVNSSTNSPSWIYFEYEDTHTETNGSGAGNYRVKITGSTSGGATTARADSVTTSAYAMIQVLDGTQAGSGISSSDIIYICGTIQGSTANGTPATVTVDNESATCSHLYIGSSGILSWSITASSKLTATGSVFKCYKGGTVNMGTVSNPIPSSYTASLVYNPTSSGRIDFTAASSLFTAQGASKTYHYTTLAQAISANDVSFYTADTTAWAVGDEIVVPTTTNVRGQTELVTITGISGATIYIDSNGDGTAATPKFNYAHAAGFYAINITRNVVISSTVSVNSFFGPNNSSIDCDWASFKRLYGSALIYTEAINYRQAGSYANCVFRDSPNGQGLAVTNLGNVNGLTSCVFYNNFSAAGVIEDCATTQASFNGNFFINNGGGFSYGSHPQGLSKLVTTINNNVVIGNNTSGLSVSAGSGKVIMDGTVVYCSAQSGWNHGITLGAGTYELNNIKCYYNNYGLQFQDQRWVNVKDSNSFYGSDGTTTKSNVSADLAIGGDYNYNFGSTYVGNNVTLASTTKFYTGYDPTRNYQFNFSISRYNQVSNRHISYTKYGTISDPVSSDSAPAGASTWSRDGSAGCIYLSPSSTTNPLLCEFYIPVTAGTVTQLTFWTRITSGFNGSATLTVYDSLDDWTEILSAESITLTDNGIWNVHNSGTFTPLNTGFCRIRISALNGAVTGDIGIDDISS